MKTLYRSAFKDIGESGNDKLIGKRVTVAGIGGIGSAVTNMLAREDFELRIIDKGRVEEIDMSRMALFLEADITKFKAKQAKQHANAINPKVNLKSFHEELGESNIFLVKADCVVDATNNPETNEQIFAYCQENKIPLVMASYAGGVVYLLVATKKVAKKHLTAFLKRPPIDEAGAISPASHAGAALAVAEVFKILLNKGSSRFITFDVWNGKYKETKV